MVKLSAAMAVSESSIYGRHSACKARTQAKA